MTFDDFRDHATRAFEQGHERCIVPVHVRRSADLLTPVTAVLALREDASHTFLLESVEGGKKLARYSFLGRNPYRLVWATDNGHDVHVKEYRTPDAPLPEDATDGTIFAVMQRLIDRYHEVAVAELPRLTGGAVGYMGYDTVRCIEHLPDVPTDDLKLPDATWAFYDTVAAFDHVRNQLMLVAQTFLTPESDLRAAYDDAHARLEQLEADLKRTPPPPAPVDLPAEDLSSTFAQDDFESAVRAAKQHITDGDIFQVVLSQRFKTSFSGDRINLYRALRQVNPSPYLFYMEFGPFALVGSSPEVLVRVEDGQAEVLPIAGTRPRGETSEEDVALAEELLNDPKERAEHLMLVDLGRNDLGRVSRFGSVEVDRYAYIEQYSHVMHIVSSVVGQVDAAHGALDVLAACFPAGTVSGAPKVRAMEIIDAMEPTKRGIYAGAVGYINFDGSLDTCIAIRTMLTHNQTAYIQAGAGIVADSEPTAEYEETRNKAAALRKALHVAAEGLL
ncbi:anthranilate synthase component I [Salisaeta longa]|uniref:anthranilate synthase component I n=1 Tax=Salisaeta longa TaxID=503170 RepID=UPI0003B65A87|nr:anthranilate synthase component I [Salisaeta longa]